MENKKNQNLENRVKVLETTVFHQGQEIKFLFDVVSGKFKDINPDDIPDIE